MTDHDFTRFLMDHGLTAAAADANMAQLQARYGTRRWYEFADTVPLPPVSLFREQTEPFCFFVDSTDLLPPTEFECDFDYHRDARRTHACALERLTALFGTPEKGPAVNTLSETWSFERMSLTITTFLREKAFGRNDLYARYPELWNHCRISIDLNWVTPLADAEGQRLAAIRNADTLPVDSRTWRTLEHVSRWERGLFRLSSSLDESVPRIWRQGATIGWQAGPWSAFFDRDRCRRLELQQMLPARGGGYSRLALRLSNPFSSTVMDVETELLRGEETHTLDRAAAELAAFWQLPLRTEEYLND